MIYTIGSKMFHFAITTSFNSKENGLWSPVSSSPILFKRLLTLLGADGKSHLRGENELAWTTILGLF